MHKVREALTTVVQLIRGGCFAGNQRAVSFDNHSLATTGFTVYQTTGDYADSAWMQEEPPDAHLEDEYESRYEDEGDFPF